MTELGEPDQPWTFGPFAIGGTICAWVRPRGSYHKVAKRVGTLALGLGLYYAGCKMDPETGMIWKVSALFNFSLVVLCLPFSLRWFSPWLGEALRQTKYLIVKEMVFQPVRR